MSLLKELNDLNKKIYIDSFCIEDILPLKITKIEEQPYLKSRKYSGLPKILPVTTNISEDTPPIHPELWQMLVTINDKLNLIISKLNYQEEENQSMDNHWISISENEIRLGSDVAFQKKDVVELRIELSSMMNSGVIIYGHVDQVIPLLQKGHFYMTIQLLPMDLDVQTILAKYILKRQRDMIAQRKGIE